MINVWLAIEKSNWRKFRENFQRDENDEPRRKDFSKRMMKFLRNHAEGRWKAPTIRAGGTDYEFHVLNLYVPLETVGARQDTDDMRLWNIERVKQILPGKEFILGCWWADGSHTIADGRALQYGQEVTPAAYREVTPGVPGVDAVYDYTDPENPVLISEAVPAVPPVMEEVTPEIITGEPVYPITKRRLQRFLPDIEVHDEDGNLVSSTPATEFNDVILYMGQPKRYVE